ncbi:MAG: DUF4221 domain-containing protein [Cyclobacteriaceae bacterium]|nr:DUF4221 family protein [Cyclobacteriaceae bacterium]MCH8514811.1 DUF4221 domain-containing protein [Cyclobacteriaceae bacterium]
MKAIKILLFSGVIYLSSCSGNSENFQNRIISFEDLTIDTLRVNFVDRFYDFSFADMYHDEDRSLLYFFDPENFTIETLNLNSKTFNSPILLEREGVNEILEPTAIHVVSPDSILIIATDAMKLYMVNSEGKKFYQSDFDFQIPKDVFDADVAEFFIANYAYFPFRSYFNSQDNSLICNWIIYPEEGNLFKSIYENPQVAAFELDKKQVTAVYGKSPDIYQSSKIPREFNFCFDYHPQTGIWINYPSSNQVYHSETGFVSFGSNAFSTKNMGLFDREDQEPHDEEVDFNNRDNKYVNLMISHEGNHLIRMLAETHTDTKPTNNKQNAKLRLLIKKLNNDQVTEVKIKANQIDSYFMYAMPNSVLFLENINSKTNENEVVFYRVFLDNSLDATI